MSANSQSYFYPLERIGVVSDAYLSTSMRLHSRSGDSSTVSGGVAHLRQYGLSSLSSTMIAVKFSKESYSLGLLSELPTNNILIPSQYFLSVGKQFKNINLNLYSS